MITFPLVPPTRSVVGLHCSTLPHFLPSSVPSRPPTHTRSAASTNGKSIIPMMDGDTYAPRRRLPRDHRSFLVASLHLTFLSQASRKYFLGKGAPCTVLTANPAPVSPSLCSTNVFLRVPFVSPSSGRRVSPSRLLSSAVSLSPSQVELQTSFFLAFL